MLKFLRIATIAAVILILFSGMVAALRPGITSKKRGDSPMKASINRTMIVTAAMSGRIYMLRPSGQSWAYQGGYYDAISDILGILGFEKSKYRVAPSSGIQDRSAYYMVPIRDGLVTLNMTWLTPEYILKNGMILNGSKMLGNRTLGNISYVRFRP